MLDTVQIKHMFTSLLTSDDLRAIGAKPKSNWKYPIWILNPRRGAPLPRLTFLFPKDRIMHLVAEVSVPGFFFGHNAQLLDKTETLDAIQRICNYVEARSGLSFDPGTARVSRVDYARDAQLGEPGARDAINRLSRIKMKGLKKVFYDDTTLYFNNKSREVRIYPKLQEVLAKGKAKAEAIEAARGNLRFEYCLLNKYGIDSHVERFGLPNSTVNSLIRSEVSELLFAQLFSDIHFQDVFTNDKSNLDNLREHFSTRKAMTLTGFLEMVHRQGENFYKDSSLGFSKDSYYYALRQCRKAGVWTSRDSLE